MEWHKLINNLKKQFTDHTGVPLMPCTPCIPGAPGGPLKGNQKCLIFLQHCLSTFLSCSVLQCLPNAN